MKSKFVDSTLEFLTITPDDAPATKSGLGRRNRTPAVEGTLNSLISDYEGVLKAAMEKAKAAVEAG